MDGKWYYTLGADPIGPITLDRLRQLAQRGWLRREHLVWTEGMAGWEPASSIEELWPQQQPRVLPRRPPPAPSSLSIPKSLHPLARTEQVDSSMHTTIGKTSKSGNWLVRHWKGELPLWKSYWLVGTLLGTVVGFLGGFVIGFSEGLKFPRERTLLVGIGFMAIWVVIAVWQLVGIWRAAGNYLREGKGELRRFWALAARVFAVLGAIQWLALIGSMLGTLS